MAPPGSHNLWNSRCGLVYLLYVYVCRYQYVYVYILVEITFVVSPRSSFPTMHIYVYEYVYEHVYAEEEIPSD